MIGTYRDTDLDRQHPLSQALAELNREELFTRINLRGLTEVETAAYIRDTARVEPPAELVRRVHAETEGNPFFLTEVVRLMAEEGAFATGASARSHPRGREGSARPPPRPARPRGQRAALGGRGRRPRVRARAARALTTSTTTRCSG